MEQTQDTDSGNSQRYKRGSGEVGSGRCKRPDRNSPHGRRCD